MSLIRDAEIEDTIRAYAAPLLEAAGLGEDAVRLYIVNDPNINAFVAGGPNLFLSSGMLTAAEEPGEIIGVLAHEIGHIAGGHLVRTRDAMENASAEMILATVLAAGAIIAGEGEVGSAILSGGQAIAQQSFLRYSRTQEQSADQAAVRLLERTGQSATGLLRMFQRLEERERLAISEVNSYASTHPLTRDRIRFIRDHVAGEDRAAGSASHAHGTAHRRMVASSRGSSIHRKRPSAPTRTKTNPPKRATPAPSPTTAFPIWTARSRRSTPSSRTIRTTRGSTSSRGRFSSRTDACARQSSLTNGRSR